MLLNRGGAMTRLKTLLIPLLMLAFVGGVVGCEEGKEGTTTPKPVSEPTILAGFSTYTSEGLFSISYPSDWAAATSIMGELWEAIEEEMESEIPDISMEDAGMVFLAGKPQDGAYYPSVNIVVISRTRGYSRLDEVAAAEDELERMYPTPGYELLSRTRTTIGGTEAIVDDSIDNEPGYGKWRYLQVLLVEGKFVWVVTCAAEFDDFRYYEDDFYDTVRSFRVLQ
jgi:hypothetical protein